MPDRRMPWVKVRTAGPADGTGFVIVVTVFEAVKGRRFSPWPKLLGIQSRQ